MTTPLIIRSITTAPDNGLIELLERILEDAKAGRTLGICGITRDEAGEFGEFFSASMMNEFCIPSLAYLRVLQMRLERNVEME